MNLETIGAWNFLAFEWYIKTYALRMKQGKGKH